MGSQRASGLARAIAGPRRRFALLAVWAAVVALLMSTEFLFQPFIWRDFSLDQIAPAWLAIARDRLVVAATIAAGLASVGGWRLSGPRGLLAYVLAVVVGAMAGEALLSWLTPGEDRQDVISWLGRIVRWTVVGGAVAGMVQLWRAGSELAAAAEEDRIQEAEARRNAASSQLEMLRRQIEPHFLFNTLATIRRLHETDPEDGQRVLGRLFHYMSATLSETPAQRATLADEVSLVCAYLDVCASRMRAEGSPCGPPSSRGWRRWTSPRWCSPPWPRTPSNTASFPRTGARSSSPRRPWGTGSR
jgi:hypothetical protein